MSSAEQTTWKGRAPLDPVEQRGPRWMTLPTCASLMGSPETSAVWGSESHVGCSSWQCGFLPYMYPVSRIPLAWFSCRIMAHYAQYLLSSVKLMFRNTVGRRGQKSTIVNTDYWDQSAWNLSTLWLCKSYPEQVRVSSRKHVSSWRRSALIELFQVAQGRLRRGGKRQDIRKHLWIPGVVTSHCKNTRGWIVWLSYIGKKTDWGRNPGRRLWRPRSGSRSPQPPLGLHRWRSWTPDLTVRCGVSLNL